MNAPDHSAVTVRTHAYTDAGFSSRREYLDSLCEEYPRESVYALAQMLGPTEDFDGLVTMLEDDYS